MHRCVLLSLASLTLATAASAQLPRNFPAHALRGELQVLQPPAVTIDGKEARLAPGARIRDSQNMLAMSGALAERRLTVHYTMEANGMLLDVWVLTPQELARQPWPKTLEEARRWVFDPAGQSWSKR
jgi:hypothetical protein